MVFSQFLVLSLKIILRGLIVLLHCDVISPITRVLDDFRRDTDRAHVATYQTLKFLLLFFIVIVRLLVRHLT